MANSKSRLRATSLSKDSSPPSHGYPALLGEIGITRKILNRYKAVDPVGGVQVGRIASYGAGAHERHREDLFNKTGRSFDRKAAQINGAVRARKFLKPASLFSVYAKHNQTELSDTKLMEMVWEFVEVSDSMIREEREFNLYEKTLRRKSRKEHLGKLKTRLARILADGRTDARRHFHRIWLNEVLQLEYTTLSRLGDVDSNVGSIDECRNMLNLLIRLIDEPVHRGPKIRIARRRAIGLLRRHVHKLTGKDFSWTNGSVWTRDELFVAEAVAVVACDEPKKDEFRPPRIRN